MDDIAAAVLDQMFDKENHYSCLQLENGIIILYDNSSDKLYSSKFKRFIVMTNKAVWRMNELGVMSVLKDRSDIHFFRNPKKKGTLSFLKNGKCTNSIAVYETPTLLLDILRESVPVSSKEEETLCSIFQEVSLASKSIDEETSPYGNMSNTLATILGHGVSNGTDGILDDTLNTEVD